MKLIIDTRSGIAGDIVSAGLIGLGADEGFMTSAMKKAAQMLGGAIVKLSREGGVNRVFVDIEYDDEHLYEEEAKKKLEDVLKEVTLSLKYKEIARRILRVLCEAEKYVHTHHPRLKNMIHKNNTRNEAILHEAQDIIVDVIGVAAGLYNLEIDEVFYLDYVNVGGGKVTFSHGEFDVPAPAVEYVLGRYSIIWKRSDVPFEATTPTGVSILAGTGAKSVKRLDRDDIILQSMAGGSRPLPPVGFYLIKE